MQTSVRLLGVMSLVMRASDVLSAGIRWQFNNRCLLLLFLSLLGAFRLMLFSSLYHFPDLLLLMFVLRLLECDNCSNRLVHHLKYLFFLRFVLMR